MKKVFFILFIGLFSESVLCQTIETNLTISPLISLKSNSSTTNKMVFGEATSVQVFYSLTKHFAIGSGLAYSYENYKFVQNFDGAYIPEEIPYYVNKLTINTLRIPLILRMKTLSGWWLTMGYGLEYALDDKVSVSVVTCSFGPCVNPKIKNGVDVPNKSIKLKHNFNNNFTVGFGKIIKIKELQFLAGIYYLYSFADYTIEHKGAFYDLLYIRNINPQHIGIKIGLKL